MSVVIVGGHDRMVRRYKEICRQYKCRAKVFTQMPSDLKKQLGSPDLIILLTSTVSHKMVLCTVNEAKKTSATVLRSHSSSASALTDMLDQYFNELPA